MEGRKRLAWFILARMVVATLLLVSTAILNVSDPWSITEWGLGGLFRLIGATYVFSLVSLLCLRLFPWRSFSLTYFQIIWDLLFVTLLLLMTGGIASPFSFLYLLSIINSSVLLSRREALYTASLCGILYGSIVDLQYYGVLAPLGLTQWQALQFGTRYILYTIFVNIFAFYVTAFLTGYLAEKARVSERALKTKQIDYEELEILNTSIVASLTSGLLTVNNEDRIRVFNTSAAHITGLSIEEVYDQPIQDVLPQLVPALREIGSSIRGELVTELRGESKTLGFSSAFLRDKNGVRLGTIINFQDLSPYKRLEVELKRRDRLAAVGELSAAIAHEIRNPLASISGSVQMIAGSHNIDEADRRLVDIVVRETDRLNGLIRDFLSYARPNPPMKLPLSLASLVGDIRILIARDERFQHVTITARTADIAVAVDPDQFKQVLWNLLLNAAQAAPERVAITIEGKQGKKEMIITVADDGPGMDEATAARIFNPFFTTKKGGSGLGLATVYRIIEAHDGRIEVASQVAAGTTFTIHLPG